MSSTPATADVEQTDKLGQIAAETKATRADEARVREAVEIVGAHRRSWKWIAVASGYKPRSPTAAHQTKDLDLNRGPAHPGSHAQLVLLLNVYPGDAISMAAKRLVD